MNAWNKNVKIQINSCISDSVVAAKNYIQKSRALVPLNYCLSPKKKRGVSNPTGHRLEVLELKSTLKVKSEDLSRLKKAIEILNCQIDKKCVDVISDGELEEYDDLIDNGGSAPQNTNGTPQSHSTTNDDDDCIVIGAGSQTVCTNAITVGIAELLIDRDFSSEYTYITDVREIN